jgi:predicted permease
MNKLLQVWRRLLFQLRRGEFDRDLQEEMRFHLEMKIEANIAAGMKPAAARHAAQRQFGNQTLLQEVIREMWGFISIETLLQDLRYGMRLLRRSPGFTVVAVISLALGIGANTAIFSLIDAVLLRMLPVKEPEHLVVLNTLDRGKTERDFSYPAYQRLRDQSGMITGMLAASNTDKVSILVSDQGTAEAELVGMKLVSGNYFSVLGVDAVLGRTLTADDTQLPGERPLAVISHGYWQRRFGLSPVVIGKSFTVKGTAFTIIGVTPPKFFGESVGEAPDVWIPLTMRPRAPEWLWNTHSVTWLRLIARLKPGVSKEQALAGVALVFQQIQSEIAGPIKDPMSRQRVLEPRMDLEEGGKGLSELREQFSRPLQILMLAVGLVLLIACANVAAMLLARGTARQKEIAVRIALGAGRARLVRQLLTESLLLAMIGGALGLLLTWLGGSALLSLVSRGTDPVPLSLRPDLRVLLFTGAISLLTGIVFGMAPALRATRVTLIPALKGTSLNRERGGNRFRLGRLLIVGQVALSLVLLIGAGLFVRSLMNLKSLDTGFNRENVLVLRIDPGATGYKDVRLLSLYNQILERMESIPAVRSASLSFMGPFMRGTWRNKISIQGYTPRPGESVTSFANAVGPKYFETVGTPLLLGRSFSLKDDENAPKVAVVNESMARRFFGNENPIGKRFGLGGVENSGKIEIIGVVKDSKYSDVREESRSMIFLQFHQYLNNMHQLELRTVGDSAAVAAAVRRELQAVDKSLPVLEVATLEQQVDASLVQERLLAKLSSIFGLLALLLAGIGLYGLMSYTVVKRTGEIGIRMALGAQRGQIVRLVMRETLLLVLAGLAVGLPVAFAATRLISSLLFGLKPTDPMTISAASLLLIGVAAVAGYVPARRATRVDPMVALRCE